MKLIKKRNVIVSVIIFLLSLTIFFLLIREISFSEMRLNFAKLGFLELLIIIFCYLNVTIFRGLRLDVIIRKKYITKNKLVSFSAIHSFFNHILPFRLGELILPVLFKMFTKEGFVVGSVNLLILRLYDLIIVSIIFFISLLIRFNKIKGMISPLFIILTILFIAFIGFIIIYLPKILRLFEKVLYKFLSLFGKKKKRQLVKILDIFSRISTQLAGLSKKVRFALLPLTSLFVWISLYSFFYFIMIFMDVKISFFDSFLASSGAVITNLLPINGLGSFGTLEAGWALGYTMFGINKQLAISTGFIMHIIVVLIGLVLSFIGGSYLIIEKYFCKKIYNDY